MENRLIEIKVLGPGCKRCRKTETVVWEAVAESGVEVVVQKVTDVTEIAKHCMGFGTPVVVVDGEVKSVARIPKKKEIKTWLGK